VAAAKELGGEVVIKIQAWTTGRAGIGGVAFAEKPDDVRAHAASMLAMKVGQFPVEAVLVEEKIAIDREFFLSFAIDDAKRGPMIVFSAGGGTGIEERAAATRRIACDAIRTAVETHSGGLIVDRDGKPAAALEAAEFATKDSELLACDVECRLAEVDGFYLELEIHGLDKLIGR
jgi:hypothetical protein